MGCGVSKFDAEEAGPKFKRLTKRNVNHGSVNDTTLVSQQLLHEDDGAQDEYISPHHIDPKSVCSWTASKGEPDVQDELNAKKGGNGMGEVQRNYKEAVAAKVMTAEEEDDDVANGGCSTDQKDKNEEEKISISDREDGIAHPASPSFREYCVDYASRDNEDIIGAKEDNGPKAEGYLNSETVQGSESEVRKRRKPSLGKGLIKSAMHRPGGWMQRQQK